MEIKKTIDVQTGSANGSWSLLLLAVFLSLYQTLRILYGYEAKAVYENAEKSISDTGIARRD